MKKMYLFVLATLLCSALQLSAATVTYTPDNTTIFKNPERGFTEELGGETMLTDANNHVIKAEESWFFSDDGNRPNESLLVAIYYLGNYKTKDLSQAILTGFNEDMQILRNKGFKCILRFAYDWNSKNDATLTWTKRHIEQLTPYLEANSDVIYVLQTGFVGQWGEWYYSSNHGNKTQHMTDNRRQILQAMLNACPSNRFLLVRYPMIKGEFLGATNNPDTNPLTSAQAFTNTPRARIGHHNDAFLNEYGNDGTYVSWDEEDDDSQEVRQYIEDETLYVPNGGETNVEDGNLAKKVYNQAESEMSKYHWSFCGETYAEAVTDKWRANGIFDNLNRNMGYRFQLTTATFPASANPGGNARIQLNIKNVGYAPLYNERHAYIVLKNGNKTYQIQLQSDPRRWLPNGVTTAIDEQVTIPSSVPNGTYQLYLYLPDASETIADDPRYAVRFANTNVWDANTGMNNLNASIQITGSAITPDPELSVSTTSIAFGNVTVGTAATKTFSVTGSDLTNGVTISSNNNVLAVNPNSLTVAQAQSTATITLTLTAAAAGNGNATVTVSSNGASNKTVNVTWTAKEQGGTDPQPTTEIVIDGNFNDWADETNLAHSEVPSNAEYTKLYDMRWYANETDIFYYLEFDAQANYIDILLSIDGNSSTGFDSWLWQNSGAEYLIEGEPANYTDAWFARFDNSQAKDNWDDGWVDTNIENYQTVSNVVTLSNGHKAIEGKINQAKLDAITELRVGVFTMDADWGENGLLPQGDGGAAVQMLEVPIHRTPTGIGAVQQSGVQTQKILRNGQIFILRGDKTYTVTGQEVR
ncbi:MAG: DUF4832 domain-containing protein [Paludibacteraceae bacterium]|nr:DUF4832 domain-containing protein [Paludibacteraceae bacterium]